LLRRQRDAVDILHRDERPSLPFIQLVDMRDVRMIQRRCEARLLLEPLQPLLVGSEARRKKLERDWALEPRVLGKKDLAHSALAQRSHDAVSSDDGPRGKTRLRRIEPVAFASLLKTSHRQPLKERRLGRSRLRYERSAEPARRSARAYRRKGNSTPRN